MQNNIYILLDRSGSMSNMISDMVGGINNYVSANIENVDNIMLATFDNLGYDVVRRGKNWEPITVGEVMPRGNTPLLDSAGRMFWHVLDDKPEKAMVIIVTDGHENSSNKFSATEIRDLAKKVSVDLDYEVIYFGANFDDIKDVSKSFGNFDMSRSISTSSTTTGINNAWMSTAENTKNYFTVGKSATFYSSNDAAMAKK